MADRVREFDWAATPLGPLPVWPQSLRSCSAICLRSPDDLCGESAAHVRSQRGARVRLLHLRLQPHPRRSGEGWWRLAGDPGHHSQGVSRPAHRRVAGAGGADDRFCDAAPSVRAGGAGARSLSRAFVHADLWAPELSRDVRDRSRTKRGGGTGSGAGARAGARHRCARPGSAVRRGRSRAPRTSAAWRLCRTPPSTRAPARARRCNCGWPTGCSSFASAMTAPGSGPRRAARTWAGQLA